MRVVTPTLRATKKGHEIDATEAREQTGRRIVALRVISKLRQAEFGRELGLSAQRLSAYETGKALPSIEAALIIRSVHKITLDWLFCGSTTGLTDARIAELKTAESMVDRMLEAQAFMSGSPRGPRP